MRDSTKEPRAELVDLDRLTQNGRGAVHWALQTDHALEDVLRPGFFRATHKQGFRKNDRVYVTCRQHEPLVTHATVVVTVVRPGVEIEVALLGESYEIEIGSMSWFERLGVPSSADKPQIVAAYRERSKMYHPDKGGSATAMAALNKAKDEGLLVAEAKLAA